MKKKATILVHVDALRHDFITEQEMPFLYKMAQQGIRATLIPPFGFEPDAAYLSGTFPEEYGGGAHFRFAENGSGISVAKYIPNFFDSIHPKFQKLIRRFVEFIIASQGNTQRIRKQSLIGFIPFWLLPFFDYNNKFFIYEQGYAGNAATIFDYLRKRNMTFFYHGYPQFNCRAANVTRRFLEEFRGGVNFVYLLLSDLDSVGHRDGPNSTERRSTAKYVDEHLKIMYEHVANFYDELDMIVIGDHGMVEVNYHVDFRPLLESLPLRVGEDFIFFLDSTLARFWFFNDRAKDIIVSELVHSPGGTLISERDKETYQIRHSDRRLGDFIFWMDGGSVIFPNFWNIAKKEKGMHGYRREVYDNHAAFLFHSTTSSVRCTLPAVEMPHVFQTAYYSLFEEPPYSFSVSGQPVQQLVV